MCIHLGTCKHSQHMCTNIYTTRIYAPAFTYQIETYTCVSIHMYVYTYTYTCTYTTYAHTCTNAHTDSSACRGRFLYWAPFIAIKKALHCEQRSSRTPFFFHKKALHIPQQIADEYENTHKFHVYIYRQHGMSIAIKQALSLSCCTYQRAPYLPQQRPPL